ncbi:porin [Pseudodonghicola xiamenensis]|uniref:Porin n=1 Tax=Pseudodonghicola xiamenensis TaxID=337702 RepID=A0A8J3H3A9_9RHOB|nr:porin [Pseudodonghicola xiamenensis]GHG82249.1 porin [Pseudodonghicola xiamenensis]
MKKILFATTALVATAGMAAADVKISGYGRFGLDYNEANKNVIGRSDTNITSRLRLQFDMSTETDAGVVFNARVRMQSENRDGNPGRSAPGGDNGFNGARFGVSYGGLTVNVGNIIGAIENAPGLYTTTISTGTGIDGMDFHSLPIKGMNGVGWYWDSYDSDGMGANGIEALYTFSGFTGHVSYSRNNGGTVAGEAKGEARTAIMLTYSFSDYYVTAAYQSSENGPTRVINGKTVETTDGITFAAVGADFGQFGAKLAYGDTEEASSWTLEGNMDIGAASNVVLWVNSTDSEVSTDAADGTAYGINYQYDLGGGATLVAGYVDTAANDSQFQAGVYFKF